MTGTPPSTGEQVMRMLPCDYCGAQPGQRCRSRPNRNGHSTPRSWSHAARWNLAKSRGLFDR